MNARLLTIKHETSELTLLANCARIALDVVQGVGQDLRWLQFASLAPTGVYSFHTGKDKQWETLERVVTLLSTKHPHISAGKITDVLSHLVNTTILDELVIQGKYVHTKSLKNPLHKTDVQLTLIHFTRDPIYLPRHPWIKYVRMDKKRNQTVHKVHNLSEGTDHHVRKVTEKGYTHFHFLGAFPD